MSLNQAINSLNTLADQIARQSRTVACAGLNGSDQALLISRIYHQRHLPILVVVPTIKEAQRFLEDLRFFNHGADASLYLFPPYNILPFKFLSYHSETAAQRICALYQTIESKTPPIVVTSVDALLQKVIPKQEIIDYAELIVAEEEIDRDAFIEKLVSGGYAHA
ncbi:MAG: transcription-repair coupling factor, partial [Desulfobacterales bacterium]